MTPRRALFVSLAAMLLVTGIASVGRPAPAAEVPGPVPPPSGVARVAISRGAAYPFPWSGVNGCPRRFQPGCFVVEEVAPGRVVLTYARVVLDGGTVKPQGFRYRTPVTAAGSPYELFALTLDAGREEWVYAVLERADGAAARLQFLKLPAFVTDRARLAVSIVVEPGWHRLREQYTVETEEPLTLIGLGRVETVFPSGRIEGIEVDGARIRLPYADIVHINLPPGRHEVGVTVALATRLPELTIQGTLLEPRRMSLVHSLDLRVEPVPGGPAPELEVRTVGLPPEIWNRFQSTLLVAPGWASEALGPLGVRYRFTTNDAITLKARPRIPVGPTNYPVLITVRTPAGR